MRTTLDIDSDVMHAAKEIAKREHKTAGAVLSELARRGLRHQDNHPDSDSFFGFAPIPTGGRIVTRELVAELIDEDDA